MKKFFAFILLLFAGALYFFLISKNTPVVPSTKTTTVPTKNPIPTTHIANKLLLVPYWSQDSLDSGYNAYAYFGITADKNGIDTSDPGYVGLPAFALKTENVKTLLVVRLLSGSVTEDLLQDKQLQLSVMNDAVRIAKTYGFNGIVLDLEYSGLAFPSVTKQLTDFSVSFADTTHASHLEYDQLLYGDTFYLDRPFLVSEIAAKSDGIFIMSYDFHKANGTPGPNFPLLARADSDYTFGQMLTDFSKVVPRDKLTVVFGMFGYDWTIDEKGRSKKTAGSLSDNDIQSKFFPHCLLKNCQVQRDQATSEPSVSYQDSLGESHIVWFEDSVSVAKKEDVLEKNGISQIGFWANGYF